MAATLLCMVLMVAVRDPVAYAASTGPAAPQRSSRSTISSALAGASEPRPEASAISRLAAAHVEVDGAGGELAHRQQVRAGGCRCRRARSARERDRDAEALGVGQALADERRVDGQRAGLVEGRRLDRARRWRRAAPRSRRPRGPRPHGRRPCPRPAGGPAGLQSPRPAQRAGGPAGRRPRWRWSPRAGPRRRRPDRRRRRRGGSWPSRFPPPWPCSRMVEARRPLVWTSAWPRHTGAGPPPPPRIASSGTVRKMSEASSRTPAGSAKPRASGSRLRNASRRAGSRLATATTGQSAAVSARAPAPARPVPPRRCRPMAVPSDPRPGPAARAGAGARAAGRHGCARRLRSSGRA